MNLQILKILTNLTPEDLEGKESIIIDMSSLPSDFGDECQMENGIPIDTPELRQWRGRVGIAYTVENYSYRPVRELVLDKIAGGLAIKNVLEVGCNVGNNLAYFVKRGVRAYGIDPIRTVLEDSYFLGAQATAFALPFATRQFDLVLCAGVLCHIAPDYLSVALREIERVSRKYVSIIDYHSEEETARPFRGSRLFWGRDFARDTMRYTSLELLRAGFTDQWNKSADYKYTLWEKN